MCNVLASGSACVLFLQETDCCGRSRRTASEDQRRGEKDYQNVKGTTTNHVVKAISSCVTESEVADETSVSEMMTVFVKFMMCSNELYKEYFRHMKSKQMCLLALLAC